MAEAEERIINAALTHCDGDKEKAAKLLGISSRTLYRRFSKPGS
jgi:DNA-binding NtrC family response regulator